MPLVAPDCRRKEKMWVQRKGGDLALIFTGEDDIPKFEIWFEMRRPHKETYAKIEALLMEINKLLETEPHDE